MIQRRLFTIASAVSLLLFLATLALVVVCFDRSISYVWLDPQRARVNAIFLDQYCVGLAKKQTDYAPPRPGQHYSDLVLVSYYPTGWHRGVPPIVIQPADNHQFLGFSWGETHLPEMANVTDALDNVTFAATVWLEVPLLLFAVLPGVCVGKIWNSLRRRRQWVCPACGYNLTANTSGVCPECGTPVPL